MHASLVYMKCVSVYIGLNYIFVQYLYVQCRYIPCGKEPSQVKNNSEPYSKCLVHLIYLQSFNNWATK